MSVEANARHPLLSCADAVEAALKDVAGVDPAFLTTDDKADLLRRLQALEARFTGPEAAGDGRIGRARRCHGRSQRGDVAGCRDAHRPADPSR